MNKTNASLVDVTSPVENERTDRSSESLAPIDGIIGKDRAFDMPLMRSIPLIVFPFVFH
jgi:hypothetical protein